MGRAVALNPWSEIMNLSMAIFLMADAGARAVRVSYDPDDATRKFNPSQFFKTLDPSLKVDDLVVVPTATRNGFTVGKVAEVDFRLDFDTTEKFQWIVARVDKDAFDNMVKQEAALIDRVADAEQNRKKAELMAALNLDSVDLSALDIVHGRVALPAISAPQGRADEPAL